MCNTCIWMDIRLGVTAKNICNSFYSAWVFRFTTLFFLVSLLAGWNKIVDVSPTLSTTNILAEEVQHCKVFNREDVDTSQITTCYWSCFNVSSNGSTFRESMEKRGLLQSDNSLLECMSEATSYQMPYSLRRLFATLLIYCNPTNPRQLWEQFEEHMSEDYTLVSNINKKRYSIPSFKPY
ncbi:uncharacterized protein LOC142161644 isoform X2 [Nicotiana tabacum]|uniref:Uncharacterized protein LOC142161644 isoform X2 n=3 Tax=Nicotiana tabacum TaxID=4097 RepID=A0AC58U5B1_TOBAC|nr:PREDICTED: uncharacterized protein LOC107820550 [Nicotiana tabacum]